MDRRFGSRRIHRCYAVFAATGDLGCVASMAWDRCPAMHSASVEASAASKGGEPVALAHRSPADSLPPQVHSEAPFCAAVGDGDQNVGRSSLNL